MTKFEEMARAAYITLHTGAEMLRPGDPFMAWEDLPTPQRELLFAVVRTVLGTFRTNPDDAMLDAAKQVFQQPRWTQRMLFEAVIDAVLENTNGR